MKRNRLWSWIASALFLFAVFGAADSSPAQTTSEDSQAASREESVLVGRISHVEGQVLRYVPENEDWVATVKDAPFGFEDSLYTDESSKAEFLLPNAMWIRIGGSTQLQLLVLKNDLTEVDVASGVARFFNRSSEGLIRAVTPFGEAVGEPGSSFDVYVGDESAEVIALRGKVSFLHDTDGKKYDVLAGEASLVADKQEVSAGEGRLVAAWDDWNTQRDSLWAKRAEVKGESAQYLPDQIRDQAYDLDENGRWERVHYEGDYRRLWRPNVQAGWSPFTNGSWTNWYGDNTWIPDEPFGYVTHHYGNWVHTDNHWYWAPPLVGVHVARPRFSIGFGWFPGRVSWIHSGAFIGWVPLAPWEPYYAHRFWGPRVVVIGRAPAVRLRIGNFAFARHAVIINRANLFRVRNVRNVRITNINTTRIVRNFRAAPVLNARVVPNFNRITTRHQFTTVRVTNKPHRIVRERIQRNLVLARERTRVADARAVRQRLAAAGEGRLERRATAASRQVVTNRLVPANQVNRPRDRVRFTQRDIRQGAVAEARREPARRELARERQEPRELAGERTRQHDLAAERQERTEQARRRPERPRREITGSTDRADLEARREQRRTRQLEPSARARERAERPSRQFAEPSRRQERARADADRGRPAARDRQLERERGRASSSLVSPSERERGQERLRARTPRDSERRRQSVERRPPASVERPSRRAERTMREPRPSRDADIGRPRQERRSIERGRESRPEARVRGQERPSRAELRARERTRPQARMRTQERPQQSHLQAQERRPQGQMRAQERRSQPRAEVRRSPQRTERAQRPSQSQREARAARSRESRRDGN